MTQGDDFRCPFRGAAAKPLTRPMSDISTDAGVPLDFGVCVEDGASAAARSQPAGSNLPELPQAGMKRRLTGRSEPSAVKPRDDSVAHREAAPQNSIHKGDSPSEYGELINA